jgi:hypothetical protein
VSNGRTRLKGRGVAPLLFVFSVPYLCPCLSRAHLKGRVPGMGVVRKSVLLFTVTLSPSAPSVPIVCQHNETSPSSSVKTNPRHCRRVRTKQYCPATVRPMNGESAEADVPPAVAQNTRGISALVPEPAAQCSKSPLHQYLYPNNSMSLPKWRRNICRLSSSK